MPRTARLLRPKSDDTINGLCAGPRKRGVGLIMLVTCVQCSKPVFVASSALAGGTAELRCRSCAAILVVDASGTVTLQEPPLEDTAGADEAPTGPETPRPPELNDPGAVSPTFDPRAEPVSQSDGVATLTAVPSASLEAGTATSEASLQASVFEETPSAPGVSESAASSSAPKDSGPGQPSGAAWNLVMSGGRDLEPAVAPIPPPGSSEESSRLTAEISSAPISLGPELAPTPPREPSIPEVVGTLPVADAGAASGRVVEETVPARSLETPAVAGMVPLAAPTISPTPPAPGQVESAEGPVALAEAAQAPSFDEPQVASFGEASMEALAPEPPPEDFFAPLLSSSDEGLGVPAAPSTNLEGSPEPSGEAGIFAVARESSLADGHGPESEPNTDRASSRGHTWAWRVQEKAALEAPVASSDDPLPWTGPDGSSAHEGDRDVAAAGLGPRRFWIWVAAIAVAVGAGTSLWIGLGSGGLGSGGLVAADPVPSPAVAHARAATVPELPDLPSEARLDDVAPAAAAPVKPTRPRRGKGVRRHAKKSTVSTKPKPAPIPASAPAAVVPPPTPAPIGLAERHFRQGTALLEQKKVTLAIEELRKCLRANPAHGLAYRHLGVAYYMLGREKSAMQAYSQFIRLEPRHRDVPKVRKIIADYNRRQKR